VILNSSKPKDESTINLANELRNKYDVPIIPMSIIDMTSNDIYDILKTALYKFNIVDINYSIPEWVHILDNNNEVKKYYLESIRNSSININKLKDVDNILETFKDQKYINNSYISNVDASTGIVTVNLDSSDELYNDVINTMLGESINSKASMMKIFQTYKSSKEEFESIKQALKQAKTSGYGIIYPTLKDMKLQKPEIIKQGNRYGVKLKAGASSIHLIKVDVESTFEPIIGSELQSKELINYLMKDSEADPSNIWKSEIFGRSLNEMVEEGMKAKLSIMNDNTKYKLGQTLTKIVNKGSSNLIAIVL
jgi:stage IV sporulation protein A